MALKALLVGIGGFFGAGSRYLVSKFVESMTHSSFPFGTLSVNVIGSFFLTLLATLYFRASIETSELQLILLTGFLGAFTTFSTFSNESLMLLYNGNLNNFFLNILANVVLCISASWIGFSFLKII